MRRGAVGSAMRGGLTRRRLQTIVIGVVLLASTTASVLALGLVVDSNAPFDHAFAAQRGADVTATINTGVATGAQLAATRNLSGVTGAAGPFGEAAVTVASGGAHFPSITLVGRGSPGGPVDDLTLESGHWATDASQVVLATGQGGLQFGVPLGSKLTVAAGTHTVTLTVVGFANSVTGSAGGWVLPAEMSKLGATSEQMLYRFSSAATSTAVTSDVSILTAALPAGAVAGTQSWLTARTTESGNVGPFVPFLITFGVLGMVLSALIVANVVSGAVVAGYRRIGILKSIGFTPAQVVGAYTGQVIGSAVVGGFLGVVLGNALAIPVLGQAAGVYQVGTLGVPIWVDAAVPVAMLAIVAIAAVLPAIRAGRLSAVQAIATGRAPRSGRGYAAHRLLGRLPLPRPVTIGLAAPFARPARTAVTMASVLLGAAAVTLAAGLSSSLRLVTAGLSHAAAEPIQVELNVGQVAPGKYRVTPGQAQSPGRAHAIAESEARAVRAALAAQPGTAHYVAESTVLVTVPSLSQPVGVTAFRGTSNWTGYDLITGHWFTGPGQVDVATHFLTATGEHVGDTVTIDLAGKQVAVKIVGQVFDTNFDGLSMLTDWSTLARSDPGLAPDRFDVGLRGGTSATAYANALQKRLGSTAFVAVNNRSSSVIEAMLGLIGTLTLLLAGVAGLGVLNTVALNTRERVHDLGVFKAVGMTPRQTIAMAIFWVAGIGLVGGVAAVPVGIALHHVVLPAMANSADVGLPPSFLNVFHGVELIGLGLAGVAIAVAGAVLPAGWAAKIRTASALHAE